MAVYCQHFVVHGPLCRSSRICDSHKDLDPPVTSRAVGIPRAHVVVMPRDSIKYDLSALWDRPLNKGPLIMIDERIWVDGVGEVTLEESLVPATSPYWCFFNACTLNDGHMEMATEWGNVRLTSEE